MAQENNNKDQASYRQIMRATSIFGGVQVFHIIITILRSKVIAVLLGPAGIGVLGLYTATVGFIGSLTNFGLGTSAVKDIAAANESQNKERIATVVVVVRRLVWFTGILGAILTLVFAPWLSKLSFGNEEYTIPYMWLSISLLLTQLTSGQYVLLQGLRKIKYLAKANLIGATAGLLVSVPLYYYLRMDGIVPALILTALFTLIIVRFYARKVDTGNIEVSVRQTRVEGKGMMVLGFMLSLSSIMVIGESYIIRIFISNTGGIEQVGLYNAGIAIITTYVGLVFTAMGTDYYPRLSGIAHDNVKANLLINQQAEIAVLILAPILAVFLIFIDWVVVVLYSVQFIAVNTLIYWAALGMFFKAVSWAIAFIFLAKGASKLFFWNELLAIIVLMVLNLLGYHYWGLTGLGISFMIAYISYLIQVYLVAKTKYGFIFNRELPKIFTIQFILALACFLVIKFIPSPWTYVVGIPFIAASGWYSYIELDKRLHLKEILNNYRKK